MHTLFLLLCLYSFVFAGESVFASVQFADTGRIQPLFRDGIYVNPFPVKSSNIALAEQVTPAQKGKKSVRRPKKPLPAQQVNMEQALPENSEGLYVTWLGHSSVLMQIDGVRVLLDPVLADNISPVPLVRSVPRFQKKVPLSIDSLPFMDAVFISHDHYDHLDSRAIQALAPKVGYFLVPLGVGKHLKIWGINPAKIREYSWWQEGILQGLSGKRLRFVCTPARHNSWREIFKGKTLWASWAFIGSEHRVFFSGDTGYNLHFKQIGHHYGPFDLTMIESGQHSATPRSHMLPEETIQAHLDLRGKTMLPIHWGSFSFYNQDWWEPPERIIRAAKAQGILLRMPQVGQTFSINDPPSIAPWWREFIGKLHIGEQNNGA